MELSLLIRLHFGSVVWGQSSRWLEVLGVGRRRPEYPGTRGDCRGEAGLPCLDLTSGLQSSPACRGVPHWVSWLQISPDPLQRPIGTLAESADARGTELAVWTELN